MTLAALLFALAQDAAPPAPAPAPSPAKSDTVAARVHGSYLHVALDIPGFTTDERNAKILRQIFGTRGALVGAIPSQLTSIEILVDEEKDPALTDEKWREDNLTGSGVRWNHFEASGIACAELSVMLDGSGSHDYHAFFVRGGYRFDLHVGESITLERKEAFHRDAFTKLLGTLRIAVVRRGTWDQMPPGAIEAMDDVFRAEGAWHERLVERAEAAPDDYAVQLAAGELARHFELPPEEHVRYYERAIEILDAKREALEECDALSAHETLALATAEDGLALAHLDMGEPAKALPRLERALRIAHDLTAPTRGGIAYNLACAHGRLGQEEAAIRRLVESEREQPGAIARARIDKDFEPLRESKRFQDFLTGDRGKH